MVIGNHEVEFSIRIHLVDVLDKLHCLSAPLYHVRVFETESEERCRGEGDGTWKLSVDPVGSDDRSSASFAGGVRFFERHEGCSQCVLGDWIVKTAYGYVYSPFWHLSVAAGDPSHSAE